MNITGNSHPALISDEFLIPVIPEAINKGETLYVTVISTTAGKNKREFVHHRGMVIEPVKITRLTIQVNEDGIY